MKYIEGQQRDQITLLPGCIEDYIGEDNPVRVIDAFVDGLDMEAAGFQRATPNEMGRPSYDPRDLLKLYVYGYFNRIRSSRKLMIECGRNIELFYLLKKLTPDFRTIAEFRKDNAKAIRNVFKAFVKVCMKLDLYQKELLAIDGTKMRAVNSRDNAYNAEILQKKLARIDDNIAEYLKRMDKADKEEPDSEQMSAEKIREVVADLKNRKEKYEGFLKELEESGNSQILTTDPECHRMHTKDGFNCCYNVQTSVDDGSHLIAEYEVTNHNTDQGLLNEVADNTRKILEKETLEVVADKGYESREDILNCIMNGIVPNVAMKYDKEERLYTIEYRYAEISEETRASAKSEDIQACLHAGILPKCYKNTSIEVELQMQGAQSCFIRNDDGTVTCPMGNILHRVKDRGSNTIFANKDACRQCTNKCTSSTGHKTVSFGANTKYVPVTMYGSSHYKLNEMPTVAEINPNNHSMHTRGYSKAKKVVIHIKPDIRKIKQRMCLSEHPFGTVKWYNGAHYLLCKGKEKVTAEVGLAFLAYNLRRAINMVGTERLIEAM